MQTDHCRGRVRGGVLAALTGVAASLLLACGTGSSGVTVTTVVPGSTGTMAATPSASPTPAATAPAWFDADLHRVVDKERALPDGYEPPNLEVIPAAWEAGGASGQQLRADVIRAMQPMLAAATADGVDLRVESAFRSYQEQVRTFNYWVSVLGEAQARRESAVPGHSEHQLGTTIDFADPSNGWQLVDSFADTPSGLWLAANAYHFGFAMSYPQHAEAVTGYIYEPWHFRYIGVPAAQEWHASGRTLVEFLEALQAQGVSAP